MAAASSPSGPRYERRRTFLLVGVGFSVPFSDAGAFEIVLCKPLVAAATDVTNSFQVGDDWNERVNVEI